MKLTKAERDLMKKMGSRGGLSTQRKRTLEEKRLYSQKMNDAKRMKRLQTLTDHSALDNDRDIEQLSKEGYETERLSTSPGSDGTHQLRHDPVG